MSNAPFRNEKEELEHLVQEIEAVKNTIREIGVTVSRIERHVKRAFDVPKLSKERDLRKKCHEPTKVQTETPTMSANEVLMVFDELSILFGEGQGPTVEDRLEKMTIPDLQLLANQLGVTFRSRPSKKRLYSGIIRRLNERRMLSKNTNITRPQSRGEGQSKLPL